MLSIRMVLRAEFRRRWLSWLALAMLVAVTGGTVLAGISAGARTTTAFPSFVSRYGYDAGVFGTKPFPKKFAHLHSVRYMAASTYYFNGNVTVNGHFVPNQYVNVLGLPTSHLGDTVKLLSGRWPGGPNEVLVGFSLEERYGVRIGSTITVPLYSPSQRNAIFNDNVAPVARGPKVTFRVVGIEASLLDFPSTSPMYSIYTDKAFNQGLGRHVAFAYFAQFRLVGGESALPKFQPLVNHTSGQGTFFAESEDTNESAIQASIHPQAVGWWLFALFAALAGLVLVAQALSRQSLVEKESYPTLSALGVRPRQLFGLGMLRAAAIGVVGAVGALALELLVSPLAPVGEARAATPSPGFNFDGPVLGLGLVSIILVVPLVATYSAWRAAQVHTAGLGGGSPQVRVGSPIVTSVAKMGAPPSVLIGVRNALERGKGRSSVPVVTALVGTVVAVAALVATTVFGASLSNLVATPRLYGANWQVNLENVPTAKLHVMMTALKHDPSVKRITYGSYGKYFTVAGVPVETIYMESFKGPMVFTLVNGHYPAGNGQIDLGSTTLAKTGLHVGDRAVASVINRQGKKLTGHVRVVGTVVIPPSFGIGGLGVGAVIAIPSLESLACPKGSAQKACEDKLAKMIGGNSWSVEIGVANDKAGRATADRLDREFAGYLNVQNVPTNLVNFGQAVDFPLLLGVTLALFGAATLVHVLFVSVARRRRQFALLKVLGFVRRQVQWALCWQAMTVAVVGVVIGVPAGIAIGQIVWRDFATSLGALPLAVVPVGSIVLLGVVIVVGAVALAFVPAMLAARVQPAEALREA